MDTEKHDNARPLIIGISVTLLALSTTFLSMRIYSKRVLRKVAGKDDLIILAAMVFCIALSTMPLVALRFGLGLRLKDADPNQLMNMSKTVYANDLAYPTAVGLTKVSLCFTYLDLFPSRGNKTFCYTVTAFVVLYSILCLLLSVLQCRPIEAVWDKSIQGNCLNADVTTYVGASLNSAIDCVVYLWPIRPLWKLQLPLRQRIGLIATFSIGLVVCIVGACRIYFLSKLLDNGDFLWNGIPIWLCSTLEVNLGIICTCLTAIRPVIVMLFPSTFGSSHKSGSHSRSYLQYAARSGRDTNKPQSFAFEQLSSSQHIRHKNGLGNESIDGKDAFEVVTTTSSGKHPVSGEPQHGARSQQTGVWVSITNPKGVNHAIPGNRIGVSQEITVDDEVVAGPVNSKQSDAGSEEWIFDEVDPRMQRTK